MRLRLTRPGVCLPDDDEGGAVECADPVGDLNPAPPQSHQQATGLYSWSKRKQQMSSRVCYVRLTVGKLFAVEDAAVGSEVEQEEEPKKEAMAGVGEALSSFMEVSSFACQFVAVSTWNSQDSCSCLS